MRRPIAILRILLVLLACAVLALGLLTAHAQENLLENPGFEAPFEEVDGSPPRNVAEGWTPWHIPREPDQPSFENTQPEYEQTDPDTTRIREGNDAQNIFTSFFTFEGGVFQRVTEGIDPGTEYRFSVYAYVWSSTLGDPEISELPGGVLVQAGIDPTGGTDATSDDIEWSSLGAFGQYDSYRQYAVRATAASNAITVFVRISVDDAVPDTSVWLDEAVLELSTDSETTPEPSPEETDTVAPPTETSLPEATETPTPPPTETQAVVVTVIPTTQSTETPTTVASVTPEPPTSTPVPPTSTVTPVPPTATPIPPSPTPQLPTFTPLPPQATATPIDPTPTQEVELPTFTPFPTVTPFVPTNQPLPTATATGSPLLDDYPASIPHTVRRGETVQQIAQLYGSTIDAIRVANGLDASYFIREGDILVVPVPLPAIGTAFPNITLPPPTATNTPVQVSPPGGGGGDVNYIVQPGDTLLSIAARFNTTVAVIAQRNGIVNPNLITVGQFLVIPAGSGAVNPNPPTGPTTYVVRPGDNLFRISLRFGRSMLEIAQANGIFNVNRIFAGQVLVIP